MPNFELEGKLKQKLGVQSGTSARGNWAKQDFVVEFQDGNFTSEACISAWGEDKVADLGHYQVGDTIKVVFNVRAREYNGKWYNDLRLWKFITPNQADAPQADAPRQYAQVPPTPPVPAPAPTIDDMPGDDMPF